MGSQAPRLQRVDPADTDAIKALHDVHLLAHPVDDPDGPPWSAQFQAALRSGGPPLFQPKETWFVPASGPGADLIAWYSVRFPDKENLSSAVLEMTVHPVSRRQRLGTMMLRHAARRAAGAGRTGLTGIIRHGSAGEAFATWAGRRRGLTISAACSTCARSRPARGGSSWSPWRRPPPATAWSAGKARLPTTTSRAWRTCSTP
jgi:GNAT superfamily N-acetyltransferase